MRLGFAFMIEDGLQLNTGDHCANVRLFVKVGGDVLIGLECWETLVLEHPEMDKLLNHMSDECNAVLQQGCRLWACRQDAYFL